MKISLILFLIIFASCQLNEPYNSDKELSEFEAKAIVQSTEAQKVIELRKLLTIKVDSAIKRGIKIEQLNQLFINSINNVSDNEKLYNILFSSKLEGTTFIEIYHSAVDQLITKYPILESIASESDVYSSIEFYFDNFEIIRNNLEIRKISNIREIAGGEPVCGSYWKQVKLLACAGLCSASTGGLGTVLCGWTCWCTFCDNNSSIADAIC